MRREATALVEFAEVSPFPVPRPVAFGAPGHGYPLPWAVQTWLSGTVATPDGSAGSATLADDLVELIEALRAAPTHGRIFSGSGRGGALPEHDEWMATCFTESTRLLDVPALRDRWRALRELPRRAPDVIAHHDLHPANLLIRRGAEGDRLAGVLDAGGCGPADPSLDLIIAWTLFDAPVRDRMRAALCADDVEWARGAAWAFAQAMGLVWYYVATNPGMSALGRRMLERVMGDPLIRSL